MATYQFDVEHAERWGVNEAIFLGNLIFWLRKNKAEGRNLHEDDGGVLRVWTFSTTAALAQLYPFWSARQVRYTIESLKKQGVILTGHFSTQAFDRTLWFAVADDSLLQLADRPELPSRTTPSTVDSRFDKFVKSKRQKRQIHLTKSSNEFDESDTSLKGTDNRNRFTETDSSLNVSEKAETKAVPEPIQRSTTEGGTDIYRAEVLEPVDEAISLTGDAKSRRRWVQLREICIEYNAAAAWDAALLATRQRIAKGGVGAPGAYLQVALLRELDKRGIVPPSGSEEERGDVRGAIGASLGLKRSA